MLPVTLIFINGSPLSERSILRVQTTGRQESCHAPQMPFAKINYFPHERKRTSVFLHYRMERALRAIKGLHSNPGRNHVGGLFAILLRVLVLLRDNPVDNISKNAGRHVGPDHKCQIFSGKSNFHNAVFLREALFPSGSEEKLMSVLRPFQIIDFYEGNLEGASLLLSTGS